MADTTTSNYGLVKPEVGASNDTWGNKTNGNWDVLDAAVKAVSDIAHAAMPKTGGTFTGAVDVTGALSQAGNQVWHAGNFAPGDYMPKSGGTFTDTVRFGNDGNFALYMSGGDPLFVTNPGTYIGYSRSSNVFRHVVNDSTCMTVGVGAVNVSAPLWQNGNQVWHAGNFNPANYAALASAPTFTGSQVRAENTGTSAVFFVLRTGGADRGYFAAENTGDVYLNSNTIGKFTFQKDGSPFGSIDPNNMFFPNTNASFNDVYAARPNGTGVIYFNGTSTRYLFYDGTKYNMPGAELAVNGSQVWHAGNLNPANYAGIAGAAFSGGISSPTVAVDGQFYMQLVGGNPTLNFDGGDKLTYVRASNKWVFNVGGTDVASIDASGNLRVIGQLYAAQGSV